jgi:hypothetical protein
VCALVSETLMVAVLAAAAAATASVLVAEHIHA